MTRFRDQPIGRKLQFLTLASSATALVLASGGFLAWDITQFRQELRQDLDAQAAIVAENSAAPLAFNDTQAAGETLAVMRLRPRVVMACLYKGGQVFATYYRDTGARCPASPPEQGAASPSYQMVRRVAVGGDAVGTLYISRDLEDLTDRLRVGAAAVATFLLIALAASFLIARRIQHVIAAPLLELAGAARTISTGQDDSVRVTPTSNDEVGVVIQAFNAMLDRISERNAELSRANRLKDEFLATLSHELRTPLGAVLGWTRVLRTTGAEGATRERGLEAIERNARAQSRLVEDLLEISRIVTGKLRIQVRPVDLAEIIDAAIEVVRPAAAAKQIALTTEIAVRPAMTSGDPDRLQQVAWNLISNAVKFTTPGGAVRIRLTRNPGYRIVVTDTGKGIDSRFLPHVFDAFRQADGTTTREHGGLGLGLAIARELVELHGGTIKVRSDGDGHGSTFQVDLPSVIGDVPAETEPPARSAARKTTAIDGDLLRDLRILVVDDEPDARDLIEMALSQYGAIVTTVDSAAAALSEIDRRLPDVLLSDVGMPREDGYELIRRVRSRPLERGGGIPAIAVTAYASASERESALVSGYEAHVAKPFEPEALAQTVAALCRAQIRPS
ncbi:MAG TPA: ATP-binding protein [Vicinamibacterales bacterium]|nr:ATP-binding protein [Vicinamibacterales bacterium]